MRSTVRRISIVLLLAVLLAPGLLQARTPARRSAHTTQPAHEVGILGAVWNLLTNGLLKTGGQMDPVGSTAPTSGSSTTTSSDTGGQMDPVGTPG
ncbi:MAG: hypothetical protein DMF53_16050 [Acidobacteria bacterium]|nr:MAG: hypothetical protein DMF53_16050 [Acidobacteriota bacterium]